MRVIYRKIRHARYLYIKRNVEKVWGARYTLGARYLSKNTVICISNLLLHNNPEFIFYKLWFLVREVRHYNTTLFSLVCV